MRSTHGIKVLLAAALGLLAMLAIPSLAAAKDRNHDRIPDRWEKRHHLSLQVNQAHRDQDRDQLGDRGEFLAGDNPREADTDRDGVADGEENAGTIQSFDPDTGKLVISLFGGDTVSGTVTDQTRIRCGNECHNHVDGVASMSSHDGGDNSGPGNSGDDQSSDDNSGPGNSGDDNPAGDDNSGPGNASDQGRDPGEDPPGHDGTPPGSSEGPGQGADHTANCTTAALVVGATVEEAELELEHGTATFEEIDLSSSADATP